MGFLYPQGEDYELLSRFLDQYWFNVPLIRTAENQVKGGGKTYVYYFRVEIGYSQPTLVSLANELVVNRGTTLQYFRRLRERKTDAAGFSLGMPGQLNDAQQRALNVLA